MFGTTQKRKRYDKQFKVAAARVAPSGEMRAVGLAKEFGIEGSTLRRWAQGCEETGDAAFPGNGSPKVNRGYEIAKLGKKAEELGREDGLLKNLRALLSQGHARGAGPSRRTGANSAPSGRHARSSAFPNPSTATA